VQVIFHPVGVQRYGHCRSSFDHASWRGGGPVASWCT